MVMLRYSAIVIFSDLDSGCSATKAINVTATINTIAKINAVNLEIFSAIASPKAQAAVFWHREASPHMLDT